MGSNHQRGHFYIASLPSSADAPKTTLPPSEGAQDTLYNGETAFSALPDDAQTENLFTEAPTNELDEEGISPPTANFDERADNADPTTATPALGDDSIEMESAIDRATSRALDSGESTDWSTGRRQGQVIVSAERTERNKTCRNAYWVLVTASNQITGQTKLWCRNDHGAWRRFEP
jgi:hypothetical protein